MFYPQSFAHFNRTKSLLGQAEEKAEKFLLDVNSILSDCQVDFFLVFGTLLGAYRDDRLIAHDTDLDLAILKKDEATLTALRDSGLFEQNGFLFFKDRPSPIYSLTRDNLYMDVYVFSETDSNYRCANFNIEKQQFPLESITFLRKEFKTPKYIPRYLEDKYGHDWTTPIQGKHANR